MHDSRTSVSLIDFDAVSVIAHAAPQESVHFKASTSNNNSVIVAVAIITLNGIQERKGAPYVVVPYCTNRKFIGSFTLCATSNVESR